MKQKIIEKHILILLAIFFFVLLWSAIRPFDYLTWWLEVLPALLGVWVLWMIYPRYKFSLLVYYLVLIHSVILMIGGHYTYARMPLFDELKDWFELSRNHYDRLGHLAQGFFPAIIAREVLLRQTPLKPGKWLFVLVVSVCLAISAMYELFEWWSAVLGGASTNDFLGSQGDIWDAQWDMFLALVGSIASLLILGKFHDKSLKEMRKK